MVDELSVALAPARVKEAVPAEKRIVSLEREIRKLSKDRLRELAVEAADKIKAGRNLKDAVDTTLKIKGSNLSPDDVTKLTEMADKLSKIPTGWHYCSDGVIENDTVKGMMRSWDPETGKYAEQSFAGGVPSTTVARPKILKPAVPRLSPTDLKRVRLDTIKALLTGKEVLTVNDIKKLFG